MFRVLLVDDEVLANAMLKNSLPWNEYGFTDIQTTSSATAALELLKTEHFDACFIDIRMPKMTGLELIAEVKPYCLDTFFIIVSGYSDFAYAKTAIHHDVLDYCLKPVESEEYIPVLQKLYTTLLKHRLTKDPEKIFLLLADTNYCSEFLCKLQRKETDIAKDNELTLLFVRSENILSIVQDADILCPSHTFFLSSNECCIIWNHLENMDTFSSFLDARASSALLLLNTIPAKVRNFQIALKQLKVAFDSQSPSTIGIAKYSNAQKGNEDILAEVLAYIEDHYSESLSLQVLARIFGINYNQLSLLFNKQLKFSFSEYLSGIRMKHACILLSDTHMSIVRVAESVGYNDYHYFCNIFKQHYHVSPSEYRKNKTGGIKV